MDLSLDGMYRAVLRGMQIGLGTAVILVLVKAAVTLPGLQKISPLAVFCTGILLGIAFAFYRDSLKVSLNGKSVLITGCDSGFGYELALQLEKMGAVVFAGCLKSQGSGAQGLRELNLKRLHVIQMDVTSDEQVAAAVVYVSRHIPPQGLWAVVNNAGLNSFGYVEWVPIDICKKVMDVNVWGALRVIRAFLPLLRDTKGRIVNLSSALSRFSLPNRSTYSITKYGIQALSDCLRFEMKRWGIRVSIIEPGSLVSGVFTEDLVKKEAADLWNQIPELVQKIYTKEFYDNVIKDMLKHSTMGTIPKTPVVDAYVMALVHRFPHPRYQPMELKMKISLKGKGVLVTGCDTGFGHALALQLADLGAVVFAGCLRSQEGGAEQLKSHRNIHVVQMDITSDEEVRTALDYVSGNLPAQGLWGIVNNAGWSTFGHVEWVPISVCRKSLEVNIWGMMRVIQNFLPLIRQSKGRVVNMSSGMGRRCAPSRSSYCITKYGVEALSDCLRFEMRRWGVNVVIVEPGNFVNATGVFTPSSIRRDAAALWKEIPEPVKKDYTKEYFDGFVNNMIKYSTHGTTDKGPVLDALIKALVHQYPHPRYQPMELYFKLSVWVNTHLPEWVFETLFT